MVEEKITEKTEKKKITTKKSTKKIPERAKVEDITKIVVELAKTEKSPAKIGLILKEKYGVEKAKILGKKITQILKENNVEYDDDLAIINQKIAVLEKHWKNNKQDKRSNRELVKFIGLRKKLMKYKNKKSK